MKRVQHPQPQVPIGPATPLPERILADSRLQELLALTGVGAFARRFGLSESSLRREMRAHGQSLKGLVTAWRCRRVVALLPMATSLHLLAHQLGFSGAVSLSRWVKTQFGVTPGRLRRRLRESKAIADLQRDGSGGTNLLSRMTEIDNFERKGEMRGAGSDENLDV